MVTPRSIFSKDQRLPILVLETCKKEKFSRQSIFTVGKSTAFPIS